MEILNYHRSRLKWTIHVERHSLQHVVGRNCESTQQWVMGRPFPSSKSLRVSEKTYCTHHDQEKSRCSGMDIHFNNYDT